jgi:sterile alpha motif and leucine zipper-containing kinase AZK
MAPELFSLHPVYSAQSDIYALGMVLWEMVTRRVPYQDAIDMQIHASVKEGEREELPADCLPAIASLISACWKQDPAKRPDARAVCMQLRAFARS